MCTVEKTQDVNVSSYTCFCRKVHVSISFYSSRKYRPRILVCLLLMLCLCLVLPPAVFCVHEQIRTVVRFLWVCGSFEHKHCCISCCCTNMLQQNSVQGCDGKICPLSRFIIHLAFCECCLLDAVTRLRSFGLIIQVSLCSRTKPP